MLGQGIDRVSDDLTVTGALVFINAGYRCSLSDLYVIREGLVSQLGHDSDIAMNVQIEFYDYNGKGEDNISCRMYLVGDVQHIKGSVYMDTGRYEIILYDSIDSFRGHRIVASYSEESLLISRDEWGNFERSCAGVTEETCSFSPEDTAALRSALGVKHPDTLLKKLKTRFALGHRAVNADVHIKQFCKENNINYT